jgi:hypothetical protein
MRPWALCHHNRSTSSSSCSSGSRLTEGRTAKQAVPAPYVTEIGIVRRPRRGWAGHRAGQGRDFWKQFCSLARRRSGASRIHPALRRQTQLSRTRRSQIRKATGRGTAGRASKPFSTTRMTGTRRVSLPASPIKSERPPPARAASSSALAARRVLRMSPIMSPKQIRPHCNLLNLLVRVLTTYAT